MKYKLIIFDFDGTLADSYPLFIRAMIDACERFGLRELDSAGIEDLRNYSAKEIIARLGIPFWKVASIARFVRGQMSAQRELIQLFPGIDELLRQLTSAGTTISIVSSNSEENIRTILGADNSRLIHIYECGASLFGKASRFRKVLKRSGVSRSDVLSVGDEIRDIEASRKEAIAFGAVSWGYTNVEGLKKSSPAFVFNHPGEIFDTITKPQSSLSRP